MIVCDKCKDRVGAETRRLVYLIDAKLDKHQKESLFDGNLCRNCEATMNNAIKSCIFSLLNPPRLKEAK